MRTHLKDIGQVLGVSGGSLAVTASEIDIGLKIVVSGVTLLYLTCKLCHLLMHMQADRAALRPPPEN